KLPGGVANKHLLRKAFADQLPPEIMGQKKRGFTLPIRRWMLGPLRDLCEQSLNRLKSTGAVRAEGVDAIWRSFLAAPESQIWSRAFALCVAGKYLETNALSV